MKTAIQHKPRRRAGLSVILALTVVACSSGRPPLASSRSGSEAPSAAEQAYRPSPRVTSVAPGGRGALVIDGVAWPLAKVRLASPGGAAQMTSADARGDWRLFVAPAAHLRLFGLSMIEGRRAIQAQGYLALPPGGAAAELRAGAGAQVIAPASAAPRILAVDFDRKGGAVISGVATPGSSVVLTVDAAARAQSRADLAGRFSLALDEPLASGTHSLAASTPAGQARAVADVTPAPHIAHAPFDAAPIAGGGWRIDWMTPGGGVQSTLLLGTPAA
jgi:hypothetical protein